MSEQYPPTRPEPAQPWPGSSSASGASADATPTVQFPLYPHQPTGYEPPAAPPQPGPGAYQQPPAPSGQPSARPGPYGHVTRYDAPAWAQQPSHPPTYAGYPPPPQYDPRVGATMPPQPQFYRQQVVYQTVVHQGPVVGPKSMGVAYLLWFFLGFLGIHHFYLGRAGQGLAYLLLTVLLGWIGLGVIIVGLALLVDLFLIPTYTRDANLRRTGYRF